MLKMRSPILMMSGRLRSLIDRYLGDDNEWRLVAGAGAPAGCISLIMNDGSPVSWKRPLLGFHSVKIMNGQLRLQIERLYSPEVMYQKLEAVVMVSPAGGGGLG